MLKTALFQQKHLDTLKRAVDVYARRHQITAQNISNVETSGYRAQRVKFEELLSREQMTIRGYNTHENHLPIGAQGPGATLPQTEDALSGFDNGVNNVDIDTEMTSLATNDLSYRMATRLLSQRYSMLRTAIRGRVG